MSLLSAESVSASRSTPVPRRNLPIRSVLKSIGSLWLTVGLLLVLIGILLWGTVVEKYYGTTAAKFGVYGSWWFNTLGLILGLNSAASLVLRWPWRRQQLGFTLPHLGLIVLLVGCFISRRYGIEATVTVIEGQSSDRAYQGASQHVELDGAQRFKLKVEKPDSADSKVLAIDVPFTSGPFNWDDYESLSVVPWRLAHRDTGVLYDRDGIRLEVLDYLSNSDIVYLPSLSVEATPASGKSVAGGEAKSFSLTVKADDESAFTPRQYGEGNEEQMPGGTRILFWMTGSEDETAAFRRSAPSGPLGKLGRVVLYAKGDVFDWRLDDWTPGSRRAMGKTGLEVELVDITPDQGDVLVRLIVHKGDSVNRMILSSEIPEKVNWQDYDDGVFGTYWLARQGKPAKQDPAKKNDAQKPEAKSDTAKDDKAEKAKPQAANSDGDKQSAKAGDDLLANLPRVPPRVDFFQGADHKLYLRSWREGEVKIVGPLRFGEGGGRITAFRGTPDETVLKFSDFQPADRPGASARGLPFDKNNDAYRLRQAFVRLTVDGRSDEFWLPCSAYDPLEIRAFAAPKKLFERTVRGNGRHVRVSLVPQSFELGYSIFLNKAWAKLDPGSQNKSFYASDINLVPNLSQSEVPPGASGPREYDNLRVTLNAPLDFTDPRSGKSFRMFQSTMNGPYKPQQLGIKLGEPVYVSGLSLNDDPGRGLTYVGCLLVVAGIFVAYFIRFAPRRG
jgi:hypothetical protein